ncbi:hypothetical protein Sjap_005014 [Stephania japonica]|uniref:Terpene synthase metal-binding domain-containing protein n=1 Tax=Stephania japonica TaxID=461633 RepID=A0AAP0K369_9MAGN
MASSNKLEGDDGALLDQSRSDMWRATVLGEFARVRAKIWETASKRISRKIDDLDLKRSCERLEKQRHRLFWFRYTSTMMTWQQCTTNGRKARKYYESHKIENQKRHRNMKKKINAEREKGDVAKSIQCYMKETGVSEEVTREYIKHLIGEIWKKLNKERVDHSLFSKPFIGTAVNLAQMAQCMYQYGDGHGDSDGHTKNEVLSLLVEPL